jgi:hypothetical protein
MKQVTRRAGCLLVSWLSVNVYEKIRYHILQDRIPHRHGSQYFDKFCVMQPITTQLQQLDYNNGNGGVFYVVRVEELF